MADAKVAQVRTDAPLIRLDAKAASRLNRAAERLVGDSPVLVYVRDGMIVLRPCGDDPVTMLTPVRRMAKGQGKYADRHYRSGVVLGLVAVLKSMGFAGRAHAEMRVVDGDIEIQVPCD